MADGLGDVLFQLEQLLTTSSGSRVGTRARTVSRVHKRTRPLRVESRVIRRRGRARAGVTQIGAAEGLARPRELARRPRR